MKKNKVVLVTGGAGFIGSHVSEAYIENGYDVVIVDNLSSGKIENISGILKKYPDNVFFCKSDIRNYDEMEKVFCKYKPKIINHHAAQKSVPFSVDNPQIDVDINISGLLNILKCIKTYKIDHFIGISSGGALSKEIKEDEKSCESDTPQLLSPYAISKFALENYLKIYSSKYDFEYSVLRYANVYGPRQIPDGECGLIPIFIDNIINDKESILMTYDDMPKGCTRDYVNIQDVIRANLLVTKKPTNGVINIGSGKEESILDIYNELQKVFMSEVRINVVGPRAGDIKRSVLDCTKAKEILNWECSVNLTQGLTELKKYYLNNI